MAAASSQVAFAAFYAGGVGTTVSSVVGFLAGAIPNWVLNRRWTWRRTGRPDVRRELVGYAAISAAVLVCSSLVTGWASAATRHLSHDLRVALVTGAYLAVSGVLFVAKFAVYETVIFAGGGGASAEVPQSRCQVARMTRANRAP